MTSGSFPLSAETTNCNARDGDEKALSEHRCTKCGRLVTPRLVRELEYNTYEQNESSDQPDRRTNAELQSNVIRHDIGGNHACNPRSRQPHEERGAQPQRSNASEECGITSPIGAIP